MEYAGHTGDLVYLINDTPTRSASLESSLLSPMKHGLGVGGRRPQEELADRNRG
jgi:hypothetical protein